MTNESKIGEILVNPNSFSILFEVSQQKNSETFEFCDVQTVTPTLTLPQNTLYKVDLEKFSFYSHKTTKFGTGSKIFLSKMSYRTIIIFGIV